MESDRLPGSSHARWYHAAQKQIGGCCRPRSPGGLTESLISSNHQTNRDFRGQQPQVPSHMLYRNSECSPLAERTGLATHPTMTLMFRLAPNMDEATGQFSKQTLQHVVIVASLKRIFYPCRRLEDLYHWVARHQRCRCSRRSRPARLLARLWMSSRSRGGGKFIIRWRYWM
jgi:hypothetical protein